MLCGRLLFLFIELGECGRDMLRLVRLVWVVWVVWLVYLAINVINCIHERFVVAKDMKIWC